MPHALEHVIAGCRSRAAQVLRGRSRHFCLSARCSIATLALICAGSVAASEKAPSPVYRCESEGRVTYSAAPCPGAESRPVAPLLDTPEQRARAREATAAMWAEAREWDRQRAMRERAEREAQRERQRAVRVEAGQGATAVAAAGGPAKQLRKRKVAASTRTEVSAPEPARPVEKKRAKKKAEKRRFDPVYAPPRRPAG